MGGGKTNPILPITATILGGIAGGPPGAAAAAALFSGVEAARRGESTEAALTRAGISGALAGATAYGASEFGNTKYGNELKELLGLETSPATEAAKKGVEQGASQGASQGTAQGASQVGATAPFAPPPPTPPQPGSFTRADFIRGGSVDNALLGGSGRDQFFTPIDESNWIKDAALEGGWDAYGRAAPSTLPLGTELTTSVVIDPAHGVNYEATGFPVGNLPSRLLAQFSSPPKLSDMVPSNMTQVERLSSLFPERIISTLGTPTPEPEPSWLDKLFKDFSDMKTSDKVQLGFLAMMGGSALGGAFAPDGTPRQAPIPPVGASSYSGPTSIPVLRSWQVANERRRQSQLGMFTAR